MPWWRDNLLEANYVCLYEAWLRFEKGKKYSKGIDLFQYNLETNLAELHRDISKHNYIHGSYTKVIIQEKKRRDLNVARVRDRVIHRYCYDLLTDIYDKTFDFDVWSGRKIKGLHRCLARTQKLLKKHENCYVWRADIKKFFDHVNHDVLRCGLLKKLDYDSELYYLCNEIITSHNIQRQIGIPIGNLTSQIFANIYLHEFDRFVRHTLKPLSYVRYGDDFMMVYKTRKQNKEARHHSIDFLQSNLYLSINPKNDVICRAQDGLKFLGHSITSKYTVVDKRTTKQALRKLSPTNASSYKSLKLVDQAKTDINYQLLEKLFAFYNDL